MTKAASIAILLAGAAPAFAQPGTVGAPPVTPQGGELPNPEAANVRVLGAVVEPRQAPADVAALRVPEGYRVNIFAEGLGHPRILEVAEDGTVYVTRRTEGDVVMLRDRDGDGRAEERRIVARWPLMHGLEIDGRTAWMIAGTSVFRAEIAADGGFGPLEEIVGDLPSTGQHSARELALGPDGLLYLSIGSTCNACAESSPESAALLRMRPDGKGRLIWATGLRHTVGFDWHPRTGALWGLDHGIDWLGDDQQVEELNRIEQGRQYGWPYIYGMGGWNPQDAPPGGLSMAEWDRMSTRPVLGYTPHAAPMQMLFYRGAMFPAAEQGNGFAAMRGSWNRAEPSGYEIVRIRFDEAGSPSAIEPFVTGFLTRGPDGGPAQRGRPVGIAEARDGALLFSEDGNGVIYRISYAGPDRAGAPLAPLPSRPPAPLEPRPHGEALAAERPETAARAALQVSSPDFAAGAPLAKTYSAYGQGISPRLRWEGVPPGTRSLALLMEDPDAPVGKPFVHWLAWNLPPDMGGLPEAVPATPQLPSLGTLRQGRNTRGSIGYFGPRPPAGNPPHHYHFQLFALDRQLDLLPGASREELLAAMAGHVLAKGNIIGTYQADQPK